MCSIADHHHQPLRWIAHNVDVQRAFDRRDRVQTVDGAFCAPRYVPLVLSRTILRPGTDRVRTAAKCYPLDARVCPRTSRIAIGIASQISCDFNVAHEARRTAVTLMSSANTCKPRVRYVIRAAGTHHKAHQTLPTRRALYPSPYRARTTSSSPAPASPHPYQAATSARLIDPHHGPSQ